MNNATIKEFNIKIKLRGDNVYDLYINHCWVACRGSYELILDEAKNAIGNILLSEQEIDMGLGFEIVLLIMWLITGTLNIITPGKISKFTYGCVWVCLVFEIIINILEYMS